MQRVPTADALALKHSPTPTMAPAADSELATLTEQFDARGFCVVERVFRPAEMLLLAGTISGLAESEVAAIKASGVMGAAQDWGSADEYGAWQRATPDWQKTIVAMSKVQVMPDGSIIGCDFASLFRSRFGSLLAHVSSLLPRVRLRFTLSSLLPLLLTFSSL